MITAPSCTSRTLVSNLTRPTNQLREGKIIDYKSKIVIFIRSAQTLLFRKEEKQKQPQQPKNLLTGSDTVSIVREDVVWNLVAGADGLTIPKYTAKMIEQGYAIASQVSDDELPFTVLRGGTL